MSEFHDQPPLARQIADVTREANELIARRRRGEEVPLADEIAYHRRKVALWQRIVHKGDDPKAPGLLAEAMVTLRQLEQQEG